MKLEQLYIEVSGSYWVICDNNRLGLVVLRIDDKAVVDYAGNVYIISELYGRKLSKKDSKSYLETLDSTVIKDIESLEFTRMVLGGPMLSVIIGTSNYEMTQKETAKFLKGIKIIKTGMLYISYLI